MSTNGVIYLCQEDWDALQESIRNPPKPTEFMVEAARLHRGLSGVTAGGNAGNPHGMRVNSEGYVESP